MPRAFAIARLLQDRTSVSPRHGESSGLVTGATGAGKTVTLRLLTDRFSSIGVPVFLADVKAILSGVAAQAQRRQSSPSV
jgi:hypothetical protein